MRLPLVMNAGHLTQTIFRKNVNTVSRRGRGDLPCRVRSRQELIDMAASKRLLEAEGHIERQFRQWKMALIS